MKNLHKYSINNITEFLNAVNLLQWQRHPSFHILKFEDHFDEMPKRKLLFSERYFEFTIVTHSENNGTVVIIDDVSFESKQNTLTFVSPGQSTLINVKGNRDTVKGYMIVFTSDFIDPAFSEYNIIQHYPFFNLKYSPVHMINGKNGKLVSQLFHLLYTKFQNMNESNFDLVKAYFNVLLLEVKQLLEYDSPIGNRAEEITYRYENLIKKTQPKHQKLSYYANQLHISTIYLTECIKKVTGSSAKRVLDQYIIIEAKALLRNSNMNISTIAFTLGFEEVSNFVLYFKKHTLTTPFQFRKNII
ncbi:helix-turn-helix domain-containing protein [Elizabethkingia miricola]|uniref:helix-turn-helix domain-containing protein n=1 Tax=Elizabethkingia miricola TaxID=172045 RepID=UPI003891A607